jgi:hypothetical protein
MIKAFPHLVWMIRTNLDDPNPEEHINKLISGFSKSVDIAEKNWKEKEGS